MRKFTLACGLSSILWALCFQAQATQIRLLYMNDFHGFAEPYQPLGSDEELGGIAYLAGKANILRKEVPSLLLSAGDMWQGNLWTDLFQGESGVRVMNQMGFDAMVLGNHEFDLGQDRLTQRISEAAFPVLCANVDGIKGIQPYVTKIVDGVRIALIGVVSDDTPVATNPKNVKGLHFRSAQETVQEMVKEAREAADIVVVLSHCGHAVERKLAEDVQGIDVIVGGHSHTRVEEPALIGSTLVVQAWEHAKAIGVLDLFIEAGKITSYQGHLEEIKPVPGQEDPAVLAIVESYQARMDGALNEVVGEAQVDLDGAHVRSQETNLGDLVADLMRQIAKADAAVINAGSLRTSIRKGEIRVKDVYAALPFDTYVVSIRLTGQQIWDLMEYGVSQIEDLEGCFPQISGIEMTFCPKAPKGARLREIRIDGKLLDVGKKYAVATNDFLATGGDGYQAFLDAIAEDEKGGEAGGDTLLGKNVVYSDSSRWLKDIVVDHIRTCRVVAPTVDGRIKEADE